MAKDIILIGAGGHSAELTEYINAQNEVVGRIQIVIVGYIDDDSSTYEHYGFVAPFIGAITAHKVREDVYYLMGIANLKFRRQITERFELSGAKFTGFIHPTAIIAKSAHIDPTVVISHNVSIGPKVTIEAHNMLNSRCTIGHDSYLGKFNFISPQVAIAGNTRIGEGNLLGTNAATIPGKTIGDNSLIGAGAVVIFNVPSNVTVVGNKARIL